MSPWSEHLWSQRRRTLSVSWPLLWWNLGMKSWVSSHFRYIIIYLPETFQRFPNIISIIGQIFPILFYINVQFLICFYSFLIFTTGIYRCNNVDPFEVPQAIALECVRDTFLTAFSGAGLDLCGRWRLQGLGPGQTRGTSDCGPWKYPLVMTNIAIENGHW